MEIDSNGNEADTPRTKLQVVNFVAIQPQTSRDNEANDQASTLFRGNSDTTLVNGVIVSAEQRVHPHERLGGATPATLTARSVGAAVQRDQVHRLGQLHRGAGGDCVRLGREQQQRRLHQHADRACSSTAPTRPAVDRVRRRRRCRRFFDADRPTIGAVQDATDTWYTGWTCNSADRELRHRATPALHLAADHLNAAARRRSGGGGLPGCPRPCIWILEGVPMTTGVAARRRCCCSPPRLSRPRSRSPRTRSSDQRRGRPAARGREPTGEPAPSEPAEEERRHLGPRRQRDLVTGARNRNVARARTRSSRCCRPRRSPAPAKATSPARSAASPASAWSAAGFVYVRGLGDRYSLALLNGSPLPSPEPLRRVVPLDLFPSGVIASSLVQKSYSVNYPRRVRRRRDQPDHQGHPARSLPHASASARRGDTETTGQLGYTYYGSKTDWTGFDNGSRDIPPALAAFFASGERISSGKVDTQAIAGQLVNGRNASCSSCDDMPAELLGLDLGRQVLRRRRRRARRDRRGGLQQQIPDPRRDPADLAQRRPLDARNRFPPRHHRPAHGRQRPARARPRVRRQHRSAGPTSTSATRSSTRGSALGNRAQGTARLHAAGHRVVRAPADRHPDGRRVQARRPARSRSARAATPTRSARRRTSCRSNTSAPTPAADPFGAAISSTA